MEKIPERTCNARQLLFNQKGKFFLSFPAIPSQKMRFWLLRMRCKDLVVALRKMIRGLSPYAKRKNMIPMLMQEVKRQRARELSKLKVQTASSLSLRCLR